MQISRKQQDLFVVRTYFTPKKQLFPERIYQLLRIFANSSFFSTVSFEKVKNALRLRSCLSATELALNFVNLTLLLFL